MWFSLAWPEKRNQGLYSQNSIFFENLRMGTMEQHTLKNANNCLNTKIYSYLETSGGQSSNPYLNVVHFFQHHS
jgi:hypothetical protein